jgi:hypothetical protein
MELLNKVIPQHEQVSQWCQHVRNKLGLTKPRALITEMAVKIFKTHALVTPYF